MIWIRFPCVVALYAGNPPIIRGLPSQTVTNADLRFYVLELLNKESSCLWFRTPWRSCDVSVMSKSDNAYIRYRAGSSRLHVTDCTLQWRHNWRDGVSNHRRLDSLLNRLFRRRSKKTSNLRDTGLCEGNSPVTIEFPAQRASNAENDSIW